MRGGFHLDVLHAKILDMPVTVVLEFVPIVPAEWICNGSDKL
jgi:hypothetical protein